MHYVYFLNCSLAFSIAKGELIASVLVKDIAAVNGGPYTFNLLPSTFVSVTQSLFFCLYSSHHNLLFIFMYTAADIDKKSFRIVTREPFGQSHKTEMVVEAPNLAVKNKWRHLLRGMRNTGGGQRQLDGRLVVEGYLTKMQPLGSSNKVREMGMYVC